MAKKKVKKAPKAKPAPMPEEADESLIVPGGCGPLADYLLEVAEGHRDFNLQEWQGDFAECARFLEELPDDVDPRQLDLSEFGFAGPAAKKIAAWQKGLKK
jgi:hypothetical protein